MTQWESPAPPLADWSVLDELIDKHNHFILTTHVNPDGDGLGSEVALAIYLKSLGKEVRILNDGALPFNFEFMRKAATIEEYSEETIADALKTAEVLVILDTSTTSRIGRLSEVVNDKKLTVVVIDHHVGSADFADVAIMTTEACATGELIYDFIRRRPKEWTLPMAEAIYSALVTDTGSFRFSNTDPPAHAMAAHLLSLGVNPEKMGTQIYRHRNADRVRFIGNVLSALQLNAAGTIAWLEVTRDLMNRFKSYGPDTEGLVDVPRNIPGVEVVVLFTETDNGRVKVSLRSAGLINVSRLASQFGGGGHRVASGALMKGDLPSVRERILGAIETDLAHAMSDETAVPQGGAPQK